MKSPKTDKFPDGLSYYYADANSDSSYTLSPNTLDKDSGAIGATVDSALNAKSSEGVLMWNDENPAGPKPGDVAHQKGVLHFDGSTGTYLIHSVPKFPASDGGYSYPDSGVDYGQSFLCLSLTSEDVEKIIVDLTITRPSIYFKNVPSSLSSKYKYLDGLLNGNYTKSPIATSFDLSTAGGVPFTLFSFNKYWDNFLYEDLVAPTLKTDLICETWTLGTDTNIVPTFCKNSTIKYSVYDAEHVSFDGNTWNRNRDHSKWAVGVNSDWWCIGGINRQYSQNGRGGGTCCTKAIPLHDYLFDVIVDVNPCGTGEVTDTGSKPPQLPKKAAKQKESTPKAKLVKIRR